jgi:DNA/RNA endonuclease YhcR with UshA esterase domain
MPHSIIVEIKNIKNYIDQKIFSYGVVSKKDEFGNFEIMWENEKIDAFINENIESIKEGDLVYFRGTVRKYEDIKVFLDFIKKSNLKGKTIKKILDFFEKRKK